MAATEPWLTLGRTYETSLALLSDPAKEVYVLRAGEQLSAFVVLDLRGPLNGYIQTVCVAPSQRGHGVGTALVRWSEERIWQQSPNVFLCVSSFNDGARRLYARLGYRVVGPLTDFRIPGHDEILLRKSKGPWAEFR